MPGHAKDEKDIPSQSDQQPWPSLSSSLKILHRPRLQLYVSGSESETHLEDAAQINESSTHPPTSIVESLKARQIAETSRGKPLDLVPCLLSGSVEYWMFINQVLIVRCTTYSLEVVPR
ncbi:hypothetical protein C8R42DRAFT_638157 [Lentinula raphanica]|nr:hypothetical protein C8R42DRAFT_638157 [Lentinula raphanica]